MVEQVERVEQHLCTFCEKLPTTTPWSRSGKISHCPLCHGEILMAGGTTYRIFAEPEAVTRHNQRHPWRWVLAAAAVALLAGGAIWWAVSYLGGKETQPSPSQSRGIVAPPVEALLVKPGQATNMASAKPALLAPRTESKPERFTEPIPEKVIERSAVKTRGPRAELELVQAKPWRTLPPAPVVAANPFLLSNPSWRNQDASPQRMQTELAKTPEILLDTIPADLKEKETAAHLETLSKTIQKYNEAKPDGYVHHLKESRNDLKGLPFLLGTSCQILSDQASATTKAALAVRMVIERSERSSRRVLSYSQEQGEIKLAAIFWNNWKDGSPKGVDHQMAWHALAQILAPEAPDYRRGLVVHLAKVKGPAAGNQLAKLAIFELDPDVRWEALTVLGERPFEDYSDVLLEALRHPWPHAPIHAARAIAVLKRTDLISDLIDRLEQPDPRAPYPQPGAKEGFEVRELVRVNHAKNCFLCHAPSTNGRKDFMRGLVPSPREPLPPSTSVRYYESPGAIVVRADITYLRQDFSLMMSVSKAEPWPAAQRFDFLVRTRELTKEEADQHRKAQADATEKPQSDYHQAIHGALTRLTGLDLPPNPGAWRQAQKTNLIPPIRRWSSPCAK